MTARRFGRRAALALLLSAASVSACSDTTSMVKQVFTPSTPGTLRVATALPAPGFWEGDTAGSLTGGYEWAIAQRLADRFGLTLEVIDVPFDRLVTGDLGGADLAISQISITDARRKVLDFSIPYYRTGSGVIAVEGAKISDLREARRQIWAVVDGTTQQRFVIDVVRPTGEVVVVADDVAATEAVRSGTATAAVLDLPSALVNAARQPDVSVVARFLTDEQYGIALATTSTSATDRDRNRMVVDAAVRSLIADRSLDDLTKTWLKPVFDADPERIPVILAK